ncbi:hypothetical protein EV562_113204 [Streptomyces sp. BK208]|nr:hypothetical protein [Streptomyces sp. BK208]TDT29339.1 hypothetical protein EV562_113204 [Streptomyces sp. BK208]
MPLRAGLGRFLPEGWINAENISAFVGDFLSIMSGRNKGTPYDPLIADA